MDTLPTSTIIKLGSDFFQYESIKEAKRILFSVVHVDGHRRKDRRGESKAKDDLKDMVMLIHASEPIDVPIFLVQDIALLPPLSGDSNDMAAIIRNIESMKADINILSESQRVMTEVLASKTKCENHAPKLLAPKINNEAASAQLTRLCDPPSLTPLKKMKHHEPEPVNDSECENSLSHVDENSDTEDELLMRFSDVVRAAVPKYQKVRSRTITNSKVHGNKHSATAYKRPLQQTQASQNSEFPWKSSHPSQRDNATQGKGSAPGLRAVSTQHSSKSTPNRSCTGVFITRIEPKASASSIETYVRRETGLSVQVEKLKTKYNTYSSFHIRCDSHIRSLLLDENLWPSGVLFKPFYC